MKTPRRSTPNAVVTTTVQLQLAIIQRADELARKLGISRHKVICTAVASSLGSVATAIQQQS